MVYRRLFTYLLVLCCPLQGDLFAGTASELPAAWTIRGATTYALQHNPDAALAVERIRIAEADGQQARAAFLPQVTLGAEYSRTNNPMYSFGNILNQGLFTNSIDFNNPGVTDTLQGKAMIQYRLYNGGQDQATLDAAGAQGEAAGLARTTILHQLEFEVVRAFCTIVLATDTVAARQAAVEAMEASLAVARARYQEGSLLQSDVLSLEVRLAQASEQLIQARHGLQLAQRSFLHLLGLSGEKVTIDTTDGQPQEIPEQRDIHRRPELAVAAAEVKIAEAGTRQARAQALPKADAVGSYQVDQGLEKEDGSGNSWVAGLRLSYPLFDGGLASAANERAAAQLRAAKERQRKIELACSLEMEQATLTLQQEEERLKVTGKMVAAAEESARLARLRFKEGVFLASELIETEKRLTEARLSHLMATAARKIAIADLRRTVGLGQFAQGR